jgi:hypothetical protein
LFFHGTKAERLQMKKEITRRERKKKKPNENAPVSNETMPVFITSFEIAINERPFLQRFHVC